YKRKSIKRKCHLKRIRSNLTCYPEAHKTVNKKDSTAPSTKYQISSCRQGFPAGRGKQMSRTRAEARDYMQPAPYLKLVVAGFSPRSGSFSSEKPLISVDLIYRRREKLSVRGFRPWLPFSSIQ